LKILLLDKDFVYCKELINAISSISPDIRISFIANNMDEILERFDVDIVLANYEFCNDDLENKFRKASIIYLSDYTSLELGTISKTNIDIIIETIESRAKFISDEKLENAIDGELALIGYNFSLIGTKCLSEAVKILYREPGSYYSKNLEITIYPPIAEKLNLSTHTVKNNITYATNKMLEENDKKKLFKYFGFKFSKNPGTKTIVCTILENVKLKLPL